MPLGHPITKVSTEMPFGQFHRRRESEARQLACLPCFAMQAWHPIEYRIELHWRDASGTPLHCRRNEVSGGFAVGAVVEAGGLYDLDVTAKAARDLFVGQAGGDQLLKTFLVDRFGGR